MCFLVTILSKFRTFSSVTKQALASQESEIQLIVNLGPFYKIDKQATTATIPIMNDISAIMVGAAPV